MEYEILRYPKKDKKQDCSFIKNHMTSFIGSVFEINILK